MTKPSFIKFLLLSLVLASSVYAGIQFQNKKKTNDSAESNVVVLELFTSQGCSSCPSADKVLGDYAVAQNPTIIPLAFHIDYWDHIGWKDPFSQHQFSERQRAYAENLNSNVYTPQLIINGKYQLVGSKSQAIEQNIKKQLLFTNLLFHLDFLHL